MTFDFLCRPLPVKKAIIDWEDILTESEMTVVLETMASRHEIKSEAERTFLSIGLKRV